MKTTKNAMVIAMLQELEDFSTMKCSGVCNPADPTSWSKYELTAEYKGQPYEFIFTECWGTAIETSKVIPMYPEYPDLKNITTKKVISKLYVAEKELCYWTKSKGILKLIYNILKTLKSAKEERLDEIYECPICGEELKLRFWFAGTCYACSRKGYWIDPIGGIHTSGEEDPASMYE